ncbi:hypothetical protein ACHAW6_013974 [Cyclotella cf. meneghiniana]
MTTPSPQTTEAQVAYALLTDQSWCADDDARNPYAIRLPSSNESGAKSADGASAVSLTTMDQWYEYYAVRTPSRGYLDFRAEEAEMRMRKRRAEKGKSSGGGWLRRLFFGKSNGGASDDRAVTKDGAMNHDGDTDEDETRDNDMQVQGSDCNHKICGNRYPLDIHAINHEAQSFHRFHLTSERRALVTCHDSSFISRENQIHDYSVVLPVRISIGWDDNESMASLKNRNQTHTHLCVVGYGRIAEFPSLPESSELYMEQQDQQKNHVRMEGLRHGAAKISLTSDWNELLSFTTNVDKDDPKPLYDLRHCRAASIGSDCLMISWGLGGDGSIVFYRRQEQTHKMSSKKTKHVNFDEKPNVGWVVVAYTTPSESVIEAALQNMTPDPYLDEEYDGHQSQQDHYMTRLYELGSLRVTDLAPMVVNNDSHMQQNPGATASPSAFLAISRLGGFIELLPLPNGIWLDQTTPVPSRKIIDLSAVSQVTAFSTSNHHADITAIDAYRTRGGAGIEGDGKHPPDELPAEFVLAACGRSSVVDSQEVSNGGTDSDGGSSPGATISFWGITTVRSNERSHGRADRGFSFDFIVKQVEWFRINNCGADSSVFVSNTTMEHWSQSSQQIHGNLIKKKKQLCDANSLCTVATSAPIISLRFTPTSLTTFSFDNGVLLAALDYNGGVTVMDCTNCIRSVERINICHRHDATNGIDSTTPDVLMRHTQISFLTHRESSMTIRLNGKSLGVCRTTQLEWWRSLSPFAMGGCGQSQEHCLVDPSSCGTCFLATNSSLTRHRKNITRTVNLIRLQRWDLSSSDYEDVNDPVDVFFFRLRSAGNHMFPSTMLLPMRYQTSNETLSLLRTVSSPHYLSLCGIRKFSDPTDIITGLLHQSNPETALDVARSFGGAQHFGSAIMNKCRMQLWEEQRNIESLKLIHDDVYVVHAAMCLDQTMTRDESSIDALSIDNLVDIYRESLRRVDKLVGNSGSHVVDQEWLSSSAAQLRECVRRIGTFQLLLEQFADGGFLDETFRTESISRRFLRGFQQVDLFDIASSAASRGDIDSLTIIMARHPVPTFTRMALLELIPLEIDIAFYEHLLPCSPEGHKDGLFLLKSQSGIPSKFLEPLEMLFFLCEYLTNSPSLESNIPPLRVVTCETDEEFILRNYYDGEDMQRKESSASREEVACWYLKLCLSVHDKTGEVYSVKRICELGLVRLGFISFADDGTYKMTRLEIRDDCPENGTVSKLVYLYSAAEILNRIVIDKAKETLLAPSTSSIQQWAAEKEFLYSIVQFCSMDARDAVSFILESAQSPLSTSFLFHRHVAQYIFGGSGLTPTHNGVIKSVCEWDGLGYDVIVELCLDKLRQTKTRKRKVYSDDAIDLDHFALRIQSALSFCSIFASFVVNKWSDDNLIAFACAVFGCTLTIVDGEWGALSRGVIDQLWSIFESLPFSSAINAHEEKSVVHLKLRLVMIQLCCKWGGGQPISRSVQSFVSSKCVNSGDNSVEEDRLFKACSDVVGIVSRGFCECSAQKNGQERDHLFDFVCDLDEFDKLYFGSRALQTGLIGVIVTPSLLNRECFTLLKDLLRVRPCWFCQNHARSVILSFISEASSPENDIDRTSIALKCVESLGPLFPELEEEFERQQRFHDAKQYATEEMRLEIHLLDPLFSGQFSNRPLSLVEALLSTCPRSLLLGCEFWSEEMVSLRACSDAASYFSSRINASLNNSIFDELSHDLPPMPGAHVMRMATVLGLQTSFDLLLVKKFMVNEALHLCLAPAAIAICYSMLCDAAFARQETIASDAKWTERHEFLVQRCVVASITVLPFDDIDIKKNLYTLSLRLFQFSNSPLLLEEFLSLEYGELAKKASNFGTQFMSEGQLSGFKANATDFVNHPKQSLLNTNMISNPFYDMSLIFNEINQATSTDVYSLMSSLQTSEKASYDSVLNDLGQALLNWSVESAFKLTLPNALPAAKIKFAIEFGASCLAELTQQKTASLVMDMALEEFDANSSIFKSKDSAQNLDAIKPDKVLAQRLHERGYSWNAAQRACIMTNNRSYSEALGWAVAHFQDDDFDTPLCILNNSNLIVRQDLIDLVRDLLHCIQARLETDAAGRKSAGSIMRYNESMIKASKATSLTSIVANKSNISLQPPVVDHACDQTKVFDASMIPSRPSVPLLQTIDDKTRLSNSNLLPQTPTRISAVGHDGSAPPNSAGSMSSIDGSLGSRASVNRQVNRGKVLGTQKLSAEERKRLALEGRRLLEAARHRNKGVLAPPASIVTKHLTKS